MTPLWITKDLKAALSLPIPAGIAATGVSIDTRTLQQGDVFVAITGEHSDGNTFVDQAFAKGAAAAIVRARSSHANTILVDDTTEALEKLAQYSRQRFSGILIALTGSVGKTTAKEMLLHCLDKQQPSFATIGNLNNHFGVPLTLSRLPADKYYAIIEMGMNHGGEIAPLSYLAQPHVALITTIAAVHIGNFANGLKGIANAKAEIFAGLKPDGIAVLPLDTPYFETLQRAAQTHQSITFGNTPAADCQLLTTAYTPENVTVTARIAEKTYHFTLTAPSPALVHNALATLAVCHAINADVATAAQALETYTPLYGRGMVQAVSVKGKTLTLIDETYNASPASMNAAIETLRRRAVTGRRIAVLGDMLELGEHRDTSHDALIDVLKNNAIDKVFAVGPAMEKVFIALPKHIQGIHAPTAEMLASCLLDALESRDTVMVKGSAGMKMQTIIKKILS
jgi:UDP-N-acetylmuramoyl-tripeptide--D-alanyl-D-alanine ligase